jgi:hypothetical protein
MSSISPNIQSKPRLIVTPTRDIMKLLIMYFCTCSSRVQVLSESCCQTRAIFVLTLGRKSTFHIHVEQQVEIHVHILAEFYSNLRSFRLETETQTQEHSQWNYSKNYEEYCLVGYNPV